MAETDFGLSWPHPLFPYQRTGIRAFLGRPSLLLADEMGLGKTIQAIGALRCLFRERAAGSALVVAPAGLVLQWRREMRLWAPELRLLTVVGSAGARTAIWHGDAQVFIASYETVRTDLDRDGCIRRRWDVVVIDEAQRIKNPQADVARAIKRLRPQRAWALTGTPLENQLDDLVSVLDFVAPGRFRPETLTHGLRKLLEEVQLRRRRTDVLQDLPPKLPICVPISLEPRQRAAYERAERRGVIRLVTLGAELRISHVLELILRLKQICNFCPETGASAKRADRTGGCER
jgi:SNF2 family DNA or RNA helicase